MARTWYESLYRESGHWQAAALIRLLSILMAHAELRGCSMKRRTMLTVIPGALVATAVPGFAAAIPPAEPRSEIMDLYAKWCAAEAEFSHQGELRGFGDETKAERAAGRLAAKLRARLIECQPKTLPEVAAMLHILWDTLGWQPDEEDTFWNGGAPSLLASIWRGASGREGVPHN